MKDSDFEKFVSMVRHRVNKLGFSLRDFYNPRLGISKKKVLKVYVNTWGFSYSQARKFWKICELQKELPSITVHSEALENEVRETSAKYGRSAEE